MAEHLRLRDPVCAVPGCTTTHGEIGQLLTLDTRQNTDLLTPAMVELLEDAWAEHEAERLIASLAPLDEEIAEPEPPPF